MALQLRISAPTPPLYTRRANTLPPRSRHSYNQNPTIRLCPIRAVSGGGGTGDTYLDMWKRAVERENMEKRFRRVLDNSPSNGFHDNDTNGQPGTSDEEKEEIDTEIERKTTEFNKILEVPAEKRDRVQRLQVIDRAAAAIAAARSILAQNPPTPLDVDPASPDIPEIEDKEGGGGATYERQVKPSALGTPGPDFWSWIPPQEDDLTMEDSGNSPLMARKPSTNPNRIKPVLEKDRTNGSLSIPFVSKMASTLPPIQSLEEVTTADSISMENSILSEEHTVESSEYAAEAARALDKMDEKQQQPCQGRELDGSRWWKISGVETRPDGVVCRWTMTRGVTADEGVEWEDKYWEASDESGFKELGSEKSGRDARGNVWHEYWREAMWQEAGLMHMEKTADKWGKKGEECEWQEKWFEHYDASGKTDKWAHKWCSLDPNTQVEVGHAHVWHERWGEKYDGFGGSEKYTDKWAERFEGDGWSKWGDKWDEHFDLNSHGVKQGETWWQGKHDGEQWNRTWGEQHNNSGWVHKYGKSSCGEHWDNHQFEDTWYERFPHYGFMHCLENTVQLREVKRPSEMEEE